jgi:hypothetical protein
MTVEEAGILDDAVFWKMCIGRASKNSWANMKGVDVSSRSASDTRKKLKKGIKADLSERI